MKILNLTQGSPEWIAHRARHFNASDAPAMMGCEGAPETRTQLLHRLHTGMAKEFSEFVQDRVIDPGHRFEALARPLAEQIIGDDLYAVTAVEGRLSASFDGLTLNADVAWEHKRLNEALRAAIPAGAVGSSEIGAGLPLVYRIQLQQQLMISGAERALFTASEWDADGNLIDARHCWYRPDYMLRAQIIAGWVQFDKDLAAYTPKPAAEPAPTGRAPDTLPALRIEVTGAVTASNLAEFKATALGAIRSVNRDLKTDQDFADADRAVKWCADVESRLKAAKEHALSQTADIDALFKTLDDISAEARRVRLDLDKLVTRRKTEVKEAAVAAARKALDAHIAGLNGALAPMALRPEPVDFGAVIKGLRSIASMDDALNVALANAKIAADAQHRRILANVSTFETLAEGLEFLFSDLGAIVHKAADDFATLVQARVSAHRAAEAEKARKAAEAEAARIAEAERQAAARAAAQAEARVRAEIAAREEAKRLAQQTQQPVAVSPVAQDGVAGNPVQSQPGSDSSRFGDAAVERAAAGLPPASVGAVAAPNVIAANDPATVKLGDVADRLGFTLSADFVACVLKVQGKRDGRSTLYTETQFVHIVHALHNHLTRVLNQRKAA